LRVNAAEPPQSEPQPRPKRRVINATCATHPASNGFTNLVVTQRDGNIVLDPHATGQCLLTLDNDAARTLHETLKEWLD
jgi:hypothetical protein